LRLAEREMLPIFHVNDPENFWDPAREQGWFYGDDSFIAKAQ